MEKGDILVMRQEELRRFELLKKTINKQVTQRESSQLLSGQSTASQADRPTDKTRRCGRGYP